MPASVVVPASTTWATGWRCGPVERQWKPNEPSIAPTTNGSSPTGPAAAGMLVATRRRSRAARASGGTGAAQVGGSLVADADEQDQLEGVVVGAAAGDRQLRDLARLARGLRDVAGAEQVEAGPVLHLGRAGSEHHAPAVTVAGQDGQRDHVDPPDGMRQHAAQRKFGR